MTRSCLVRLPVGMTYKAAKQQKCLTAGLQLHLVQQCCLACHGPAAMWHPHMAIHVIADVIIIICAVGCRWGRRGGAEQAADGSICIVQVHEGFIVISTQAPDMQGLHLGSKNSHCRFILLCRLSSWQMQVVLVHIVHMYVCRYVRMGRTHIIWSCHCVLCRC
jgi:hypothetical protein